MSTQRESWKAMLLATPVRNVAVEERPAESGTVCVAVKTVKPWYLRYPPLSWIVPVRKARVTELDRIGSGVWRLCDGTRTVEAMVDTFAEQHRLTFHESRVAVTTYLKDLIKRGLLAIEMADSSDE